MGFNYLICNNEVSNGNYIRWIYDAEGNKLRKITKTGTAAATTTDYASGIEYRGTALDAIYHSEGRVKYTGTTPRYEYTLSDHLGNGRVYYTDLNNNGAGDITDIIQDNHYYPFGLNHTDPRRNAGNPVNLYQYNGKELVEDNGLGWHSYGKRYYDAAICRFPNVDPLIDTFHFVTGYNYAENEPVAHIDLWGLQKVDSKLAATLIDNGNRATDLGDKLGKAEVVITAAGALTAQPEVVAAGAAVGTVGGVTETIGRLMTVTGKTLNGTATPKDYVDAGISIYLEWAVPEPVEQVLKETGAKNEIVQATTAAISTGVSQLWEWFTTPASPPTQPPSETPKP